MESNLFSGIETGGFIDKKPELKERLDGWAVRGLYEAISFRRQCLHQKKSLDENVIKELHRRVLKYIDPDNAGIYRKKDVFMSDAAFTPSSHEKIPVKMQELIINLNARFNNLSLRVEDVPDVVNVAAFTHCRLAKVQPFLDGNKRTSRLVTNLILMKSGLAAVTNWEPREEYFRAFYQSLREENSGPFAQFLAKRILERYSSLEWKMRKKGVANFLDIDHKKEVLRNFVNYNKSK